MELAYIHPDDVHAYWPYVKPRLEKVKAKTNARWLPEDVYAALKSRGATLHIVKKQSTVEYAEGVIAVDYLGLVVLRPSQDYDGKVLWVWVAFSENPDVVDRFIPELVEYARNMGAKRLAFSSPRKWERRLKRFGWSEAQAIFEKVVA